MDDWRGALGWAWRWAALMLALSCVAYLFAYLVSPADQVFLGFLANNDDNQLYLSYMREGAEGAWLTTVRFTPEEHEGALLLPVYHVLGKVARALGAPNELVFHVARLVGGIGLLGAVYWLIALVLPTDAARRSAFLLVCFSSGLGWLLAIAGLADRWVVPVDIRMPESSTFLTVFTSPHFVLGVTLEVLTFAFYLGAERRRGHLVGAALSLLLLSLTLVYSVIVVAGVLVVLAVVRCAQERRLCGSAIRNTIAVGLPCTPVIAYYVLLLTYEPFWSVVYGEHDVVASPPLLALVLGYGLVFGLAVLGIGHWARERRWTTPRLMVAIWVVVNGLLAYAPLAFQGKLLAGWHVALCLAGAAGLHGAFLPWLGRRAWFARAAERTPHLRETARNVALILTVPTTMLVSLLGFRVALAEHYFPYYLPVDDVAVVRWLATRTDDGDVLLASYGIANYWVAHSSSRAFLGHQDAVLDPVGKDDMLRRFYSGTAADEEQRALVREYGITHVFHGALERELGGFDPATRAWLELRYRWGDAAVYRVALPSGELR
ncbi:MAG: hypothetical protein JXA09_12130 [Anaerolineae bacterium]|nr:hypothetical protein [Anaerolineae bacterium]